MKKKGPSNKRLNLITWHITFELTAKIVEFLWIIFQYGTLKLVKTVRIEDHRINNILKGVGKAL
jgi:hypothetical protein